MKIAAEFFGEWDSRRRVYRWPSLGKMANFLGVQTPNSHRALGDCLTTRGVLLAMAEGESGEEV